MFNCTETKKKPYIQSDLEKKAPKSCLQLEIICTKDQGNIITTISPETSIKYCILNHQDSKAISTYLLQQMA